MQTVEQPNWWQRNWKWFLPTGCLVVTLLVAAFIGAIFWFVFALMKHSDVYAHALQTARASEAVRAEIGTPIEEGWFTTGSIQETGPSGSAELAIPVSGPRGGGTIYVEARKSTGRWTYSELVFEADAGGKRIDLAAAPAVEQEQ